MSVPGFTRRWDEPKLEIGNCKRANTRLKAVSFLIGLRFPEPRLGPTVA